MDLGRGVPGGQQDGAAPGERIMVLTIDSHEAAEAARGRQHRQVARIVQPQRASGQEDVEATYAGRHQLRQLIMQGGRGGVGDDLSRLIPLATPTGPLGNNIQLQSMAAAKGQA